MPPAKRAVGAVATRHAKPVAIAKTGSASAGKVATKKAGTPVVKTATAKKEVAAPPPVTVTLRQIAAELAESHDIPKKLAETVLGDMVTVAVEHLKSGDKIRMTGLGILQVRDRPARMGRNPATGESVQIKASRKIAFRPSKELKEAI